MPFQLDTVFVWVNDLDHAVEWHSRPGIPPTDGQVTDTGMARFAGFTDPDGNEIQLLERR